MCSGGAVSHRDGLALLVYDRAQALGAVKALASNRQNLDGADFFE
jgi:hypothetical protein